MNSRYLRRLVLVQIREILLQKCQQYQLTRCILNQSVAVWRAGVRCSCGREALLGMRVKLINFAWIAAAIIATVGSARADVVSFESLVSSSTPLWFDGTLDSPLAITAGTITVTLTGGELLNDQAGQFGADHTVVYATENIPGLSAPLNYPGVYSDPLKVGFSTGVSGFSVQITNELNNWYQLTDNLGNSTTLQYLAANTTQTLSLADTGITWVKIYSYSQLNPQTTAPWEYAIDNITFNGTSVPEPSTLTMLLSLGGIAIVMARKRRTA